MARIRFISRSDDLGSSHSANCAIEQVVDAGFIKNVSIMAPGSKVKEAAEMFKGKKSLCFGMHTTLNAEWDTVKWRPLTQLNKDSGLVDNKGNFLSDPNMFLKTKPKLELIMREVNAQLEHLNGLGFKITYIDSHMLPEAFVDGLDDCLKEFAEKKGLIDHMYYYNIPPKMSESVRHHTAFLKYIENLADGQYFLITHPSLYTQEMLKTGNESYSGEEIAIGRAEETRLFADPMLEVNMGNIGCQGIRYDEAVPKARANIKDFLESMT